MPKCFPFRESEGRRKRRRKVTDEGEMPSYAVVHLIIHSCLLTVIHALPVIQTTTSQETDIKQTETPVELSTLNVEIAESQQLPSSDSKENLFAREEEKKKNETEFRACKFFNVTYQHREQIPRRDPCEICVCVDSQVYCFWKLCTFSKPTTSPPPPSTLTPACDRHQTTSANQDLILGEITSEGTKSNEIVPVNKKYSKVLTDERKLKILKKLEPTSPSKTTAVTSESTSSDSTAVTHTVEPVVCYVMGVMYKYGEVLPKDTGTCLECSCSDGGRVTCSPKDCVSQPDLDYLSHDNNMEMFDIDTF